MLETSAGAIIYTKVSNEIFYLLTKDFHNNWGFAKGHLEKGENEVEAAKREIKEETGLDIILDTNFKEELYYPLTNGNTKRSIYFIGYYQNQEIKKQDIEVSETILLPYKKAYEQLTFDGMKLILEKAHHYLNK